MEFLSNILNAGEPVRLTLDLGLVLFGLLASFLYAMSIGRRRIVLLVLSIYCSIVLFQLAKDGSLIPVIVADANFKPIISVAEFFFIVAAVYFFLSGSVVRMAIRLPRKGDAPWWHIILLSIVFAGFFAASAVRVASSEYVFSSFVRQFFIENNAFLWWSIAPIIAMALARKKEDGFGK